MDIRKPCDMDVHEKYKNYPAYCGGGPIKFGTRVVPVKFLELEFTVTLCGCSFGEAGNTYGTVVSEFLSDLYFDCRLERYIERPQPDYEAFTTGFGHSYYWDICPYCREGHSEHHEVMEIDSYSWERRSIYLYDQHYGLVKNRKSVWCCSPECWYTHEEHFCTYCQKPTFAKKYPWIRHKMEADRWEKRFESVKKLQAMKDCRLSYMEVSEGRYCSPTCAMNALGEFIGSVGAAERQREEKKCLGSLKKTMTKLKKSLRSNDREAWPSLQKEFEQVETSPE